MQILKISLFLFLSFFLFLITNSQSKKSCYLLIGSYTKSLKDKGISVYEFNMQTGRLKFRSVKGEIENPSYLAISSDGSKVYAVSEKNEGLGTVNAYQFNSSLGKLSYINQSSTGGKGPCYVSVDDARTHLFVANYSSGSLGTIRINKEGSLDSSNVQSVQHTGSSINKESQTFAHVHSAMLSPDNRYVLSSDLGTDGIYIYPFDANVNKSLNTVNVMHINSTAGNGPRHICFHPNGNYVYVVNEMGGSIDVFDYVEGVIKLKQSITMLPDNFTGIVEAADIHIAPDGKFLYASNREVLNEIVIYSIAKDGLLSFIGRQSVMGAVPRNFVIDPSGKFLLVANQKTNEVIVFFRNLKTGLLRFSGKKISTEAPSCLKFF